MPFYLRVGKPALDRRPGGASPQAADASTLGAFLRGLVIGFVAAFVVFDWTLLGGGGTRAAITGAQRLLGR